MTFAIFIALSVVDCMHDVLEGIVPYEVALILQSLIDKELFSLTEVNDALFHFSYSDSDKNSKPPAILLPKIRIQAAESWCLVRNLALVVGSKVPEYDEHALETSSHASGLSRYHICTCHNSWPGKYVSLPHSRSQFSFQIL